MRVDKFVSKSYICSLIKYLKCDSGTGMSDVNGQSALSKASVFFERGRKVAETNNFDYAIELYLDGLRCAPDALKEGHLQLYGLALHRKGRGEAKPTIMEKVKMFGNRKDPLEQMLGAEYLFVKDPDHIAYGEAMLKGAVAGGYKQTAKWVANLIFQANNASSKPSFSTYILLKDSYASIGEFDRALAACQQALKLKPEKGELDREIKRLSAELTVSRGKYDQEGDFTKSIKDRQSQEKRQAQLGVVKSEDFKALAVKEARKALSAEPDHSQNISNLANVLSELENDEGENEAINLLLEAYNRTKDFSYKQQAGQIRIKQIKRKIRKLKSTLDIKGDAPKIRGVLASLNMQLKKVELHHYYLCVENYPTDLSVKYEYGVRLIHEKKYDEAIPFLQEATREPRLKISAMSKVGLCFFHKGWFSDAIDIFTQAIDSHEIKDDAIGKELCYNLASAYQEHGDCERALSLYRKIAQLDFGYKDVSKRVDSLRNKKNGKESV